MESDGVSFWAERAPELWLRLGEHMVLTGVSTAAAVVVGVPLGVLAARRAGWRPVVTSGVGVLQTVPSLALLALLLALMNRIGTAPALIALVLYALLPIVRNTVAGLTQVPPSVLEAADGLGMTSSQRLFQVELPLAFPVMMAGLRTAAVTCVGVATLSAFIGAGGLGQFINRGLSLSNHSLILLGAIPSALLALAVDAALGACQGAWPRTVRRRSRVGRAAAWLPLVALIGGGLALATLPQGSGSTAEERLTHPAAPVLRIGSKNFTEQLILGEIMAQWMERETDWTVVRRFDLGGTLICHEALRRGELDLYAEYTGTGWTAILNRPVQGRPDRLAAAVAAAYRDQFDLEWLAPFGFNNTYVLAVRGEQAEARGWRTISDLKPAAANLRAGWTFEFSERPDGYAGLKSAYGLAFGQTIDLEATLMYSALAQGEVDVICAFATDGRLATHDLAVLRDDLRFFPPYEAAPVVSGTVLRAHPRLGILLNQLGGALSEEAMRGLNRVVDAGEASPREAAARWLDAFRPSGLPLVVED